MMDPKHDRYRAHPAFGLERLGRYESSYRGESQLGYRWFRDGRASRNRRTVAFYCAVLRSVAAGRAVRVTAIFDELADAERYAELWNGQRDGFEVKAAFDGMPDAAVVTLIGSEVAAAEVITDDGVPALTVHQKWDEVEVTLDEDRERELRRALKASRDKWDIADDDHPVRAAVFVIGTKASWIVPSMIGYVVIVLLSRSISLVPSVAVGFIVIALLVVTASSALRRFTLDRLVNPQPQRQHR